jgi:hypothetical protein
MIVNNKMSNDENSFRLKTGMFTTCSGIWNETTRKYNVTESTDVVQCCSEQCIQPVKRCYKYCRENTASGQEFNAPNKLARCMEICDDKRNLCLDTCSLSSPYVGMSNNYLQCAGQYDCKGIGNLPDKDCVGKHKDEIFECCRRTCIPAKDLDCQKHCEYIQSVIMNPGITDVPDKRPALSTLKSRFKLYPDNTWAYILGGLALGIIVIIIWLFVTKRK